MLGKFITDLKIKYYEFIIRNDAPIPIPIPKSEWGLGWDELVHLDAEDLSEGGMKEAYKKLTPKLSKYVSKPEPLIEIRDEDDFYYVESLGKRWSIFDESTKTSGDGWANAAYAFFEIINQQLRHTEYKFYAFYAGNDLSGMFLTQEEAQAGMQKLPNKSDWPYIVTLEPEYNGRHHD